MCLSIYGKDGFVRVSYNCNQNMCSLHSNTYAWHFVSINMPSSLTIGCSGQSRKLKSAQKHCLKLQSFHHLDVTHIAHLVKRDKTTSENLPINCIDLCLRECPTCVAFHHSLKSQQKYY